MSQRAGVLVAAVTGVLADPRRQWSTIRPDSARPALFAGEQVRRVVTVEKAAVEQLWIPPQECLEVEFGSRPDMVGDQRHPDGRSRRRVALRVAVQLRESAQAGSGPADCLLLAVAVNVKPRHPEVVPMSESVLP